MQTPALFLRWPRNAKVLSLAALAIASAIEPPTIAQQDVGSQPKAVQEKPRPAATARTSAPEPQVRLHVQSPSSAVQSLAAPSPGAISPDGKIYSIGGHAATLWETATGREIRRFEGGSPGGTRHVLFAPDGSTLAALTDERLLQEIEEIPMKITLWDVKSGREIRTLPTPFAGNALVAFSSDAKLFAVLGFTGGSYKNPGSYKIELWHVATGQQVPLTAPTFLKAIQQQRGARLAVSSDGRWLLLHGNVTTKTAGPSWLWDLQADRLVREFAGNDACFADGDRFVVRTADSKELARWNLTTAREAPPAATGNACAPRSAAVPTTTMTAPPSRSNRSAKSPTVANTTAAHTASFSADGRWLRMGASSGSQYARAAAWTLWDLSIGQPLYHPSAAGPPLSGDTFRFDGDRAITASFAVAPLQVLDLRTWEVVREVPFAKSSAMSPPLLTSDGRLLLARDGGSNRLIDVTTGQTLRTFRGGVHAMSMDGTRLISPGPSSFEVRDVEGFTLVRRFQGFGDTPFAFSSNPHVIASVEQTAYGTYQTRAAIKIWSVSSGLLQRTIPIKAPGLGVIGVEFSPDGRWIVARSDDAVEAFEVASGRSMAQFDRLAPVGHQQGAAASFSADSRFILVISREGHGRLVDIATGVQQATIVMAEGGGWAVVDRDGRFDTNMFDGTAPLQWIVADDPFHALPLELYMRDYYTPRLLSRILDGEALKPVASIASLNRAQPEVALTITPDADPGLVSVTVTVTERTFRNQKSGARDVRLFRDGYLVGSSDGPVTLTNGRGIVEFKAVRVRAGRENATEAFSAYAFNTDRVKGLTATEGVTRTMLARTKQVRQPRAHLVAIGVNETAKAPAWNLRFAANDAKRMAETLRARLEQRGGFETVSTHLLISERGAPVTATKTQIRETLRQLAGDARPEDLVIVSFSGHGFAEPGNVRFHLFPADVTPSPHAWPNGTVSSDELTEWLRPIDAEQIALILDTCYSASSVEGAGFKPAPLGDRSLGQLAFDKRLRVLAASQAADVALEHERVQQGLLSYALVSSGLQQGHADWQPKDGTVQLREWLAWGVNQVPMLYEQLRAGTLATAPTPPPSSQATPTTDAQRGLTQSGNRRDAQRPALFDFGVRAKPDVVILRVGK